MLRLLFKKKVPIKGKTQLYYEAHKGEILEGGAICGYNEKWGYLIIESAEGWTRPRPYDEIFSDKKEFMYIPKPKL